MRARWSRLLSKALVSYWEAQRPGAHGGLGHLRGRRREAATQNSLGGVGPGQGLCHGAAVPWEPVCGQR